MTDAAPRRLFLLDGMALIYRAHFAFMRNPRITSTGMNTSAIFGYLNALLDILNNQHPTHIAVAFDTPEPTRRHHEYEPYKAHREKMPDELAAAIPHIIELTRAFRIPVLRYPGYEADDVIGTLARKAEAEGFETWMVTPDKDFAQLVSDRVQICKPGSGGLEFLTREDVLAKWEVERIDQVIDVLALMGDASDNVPGVPGVGEKTAKKLIAQFGSVDNLLAHTGELKGKQKENVETYAEQARLSRHLVTIDCDVPVEETWKDIELEEPDKDRLRELFVEFEFQTLGKRVLGDDFASTPAPAASAATVQPDLFDQPQTKTVDQVEHHYRLVSTPAERTELLATLAKADAFCFDLETTGKDARQTEIVGIAFCWQTTHAAYVTVPADPEQAAAIVEEFRAVLTDPAKLKVGHNLKFDLTVLAWHGLTVNGPLADTMIAHYLLEADQPHGMDALSARYLDYVPIPISDLIGPKGSEQKTMREVPPERACIYACEDADVTWQLWQLFGPELEKVNAHQVFYEIEMPLIPVLVSMEAIGISLDLDALAAFSTQMKTEIAELEEQIYKLAGVHFNIDSPKQLGDVLFEILKLDAKAKRTKKTGQYATSEQILQRLASRHPVVQAVLDYRQLRKLLSTYVDTLPTYVLPATGRVHTTYNQAVAATGRLASSNPNLQNIPIRTDRGREIRRTFIASGPDWKLMSADYSQIELRIIAEISGDAGLREAFLAGNDIHQATAARIYHVGLDEVTSEMRSKAKMVNYGVAYGMSAFGLAQRLGIANREAADIIAEYYSQFPGIQEYLDATIKTCRKLGYVETLLGRRRYIREINDSNQTMRGQAERNAINAPIQGTAADMIKVAMVRIHRRLEQEGFRTRMLLQVHDELVFEVWREERERLVEMVRHEMTTALDVSIPIVVDIGFGDNWLDAH